MVDRYSSEVLVVVTATDWDDTPSQGTFRVALFGGMYDDPDNPSGAKLHYQGAVKSDLVFKKQIGIEFWRESSGIDFGYLDVALEDQDDDLIDFGKNVTIATVTFYRVNLSNPDEAQLEKLAVARTADIGFYDEHTLRLRMESVLQDAFDSPINELYYGYEYPDMAGKPYPIAWGLIGDPHQILRTTVVDATQLLYHVTDVEIAAFETCVYDRGIQLFESASFNPSPDGYGFTLNQNPDGRITCGRILLNDPLESGYLHGLFRHVRLAASRSGLWDYVNQTELQDLEDLIGFGDLYPQFFSEKVVSLEEYLKTILAGVTGWYYVDELSEVHLGRIDPPEDQSAPDYEFTDTDVIGKIRVEDDKAPGLTSRLSYAYSPGAYLHDEVAGAVYGEDYQALINYELIVIPYNQTQVQIWSADQTDFTADSITITADGFQSSTTVNFIKSYWRRSETRPPIYIPIAFDLGSPSAFDLAQGEVDRWWNELYDTRRRFYTFTVKLNNDLFNTAPPQLGEVCTLQSDRFKLLSTAKQLLIRRLEFNYSKNLLTIEGWG